MRLWGYSGARQTVVVWDRKPHARREGDGAHAAGCHYQPLQKGRTEEPARENEPYDCFHAPFDYSVQGPLVRWASEPERQEGSGCPAPGALDEEGIKDVGLVCEVVCRVEVVREVGEEGVGGVEIRIV